MTGIVLCAALCCATSSLGAQERKPQSAPPQKTPARSFEALTANALVKRGLEFLRQDDAQTLQDQRNLTHIPAPPFKEKARAEYYLQRLKELGYGNARIDAEGNVIAERKGSGQGKAPKLVIAAHLDTVFPEGTDVTTKESEGKIWAPGIADDGRGLAALLSLARALKETGVKTVGDIALVANVGEEGLGDLRGVKALFRDMKDIDGFISIDGAAPEHLVYQATGSRRYEILFKGPGGHSWAAFGTPSAIHALGRAIALVAELKPPQRPRTTFTVGTVRGGTSVNTISASASMQIDMRSNDAKALADLETSVLSLCREAAAQENKRWGGDRIKVEAKLVGDRPAGAQPENAPIVQTARLASKFLSIEEHSEPASSTDANLPINLGIPAVTVGGGGHSDGHHTLEEWFDPRAAYLGTQRVFLLALALAGVDGVSAPVLEKLPTRK